MIREIEQKPIRYEVYWVVRLIYKSSDGKYMVHDEITFQKEPTEEDVVKTLLKAPNCFASVTKNCRLL